MKIILEGERPISLNDWYSGKHWSVRKAEADRVHRIVRGGIDPNWPMFEVKVDIVVTVYFKNRPYDSCNIPAKPYIDGLIGWLIQDDSMKYVRSTKTIPLIDKANPRVEIEVHAA